MSLGAEPAPVVADRRCSTGTGRAAPSRANRAGSSIGGQHADHRADRVPDEHHVVQVQLPADLQHVLRVAVQEAVAVAFPRRQIRATGADVVEKYQAMILGQDRNHQPPQVLIAPETVREHHQRARRVPGDDSRCSWRSRPPPHPGIPCDNHQRARKRFAGGGGVHRGPPSGPAATRRVLDVRPSPARARSSAGNPSVSTARFDHVLPSPLARVAIAGTVAPTAGLGRAVQGWAHSTVAQTVLPRWRAVQPQRLASASTICRPRPRAVHDRAPSSAPLRPVSIYWTIARVSRAPLAPGKF